MNLAHALAVKRGDVVAFVGAGGKTTAMFRLANELVDRGWCVITTTTTRIARDELDHAPHHVSLERDTSLPEAFPDQLTHHRHIFIFTRFEADDKVRGMPPVWLDENLSGASYPDILIVEADGSRRLPMKAPRPHEPVIPSTATIVIPVVGLDVLGQPLDEQHVYGAEIVHRLTGHSLGDPVTAQLIATVLTHPELGQKSIPQGARIIPLLNKVTPEMLPPAREIANRVLTNLNIERVMIGAVQETDPIRETRRRISTVILAAGESRRMGQPKLLLPWKDSTIIRHVCQQVAACGLYEIVVIAGRWKDDIQKQVSDLPVRVVYNPDYAQGEMLSSLQIGLQTIWGTGDACLVVLGDQPTIRPTVITGLAQAYYEGRGRIIAPSYDNRRGHPIIIDRTFWQALMDLPPGAAPRDLLRANAHEIYHLVVETGTVLDDIDTPDDYRQARGNHP